MKRYLLLMVMLMANTLFGQNFQNICTNGTTFYKQISTYLKAFRLDSANSLGNYDTLYISYRTIRDNSNGSCLDTTNGSILGRKILKKHDGWFCFFNKTNDSIMINTQATVNETWKFCDLPNSSYIQAQVTNIVTDSVLGVMDQVKIIMLQAKNSSNVNISHILNQKTIKLSQHYGLSQMLDIYFTPNDTTYYFLAGKTNPNIGIQDITWQQIYDFNVGDEFQYYSGDVWIYSYVHIKYEIYHVLAKTIYGNDSVAYSMEYCLRDTTMYPLVVSTLHDTITVTYNFPTLMQNNASWFDKLPEEFINEYQHSSSYSRRFSYNNRQTKSVKTSAFVDNNPYNPNCWVYLEMPECWVDIQNENHYVEGLGRAYYDGECWANYQHTHSEWNYLEYYKKGSQTWGTPIALDCWTLTNVESQKKEDNITIHIAPNPIVTDAQIWVDFDGKSKDSYFVLTDYLGKTVLNFKASTIPYSFNRQGLPAGMYFLSVFDKNNSLIGICKLIII